MDPIYQIYWRVNNSNPIISTIKFYQMLEQTWNSSKGIRKEETKER